MSGILGRFFFGIVTPIVSLLILIQTVLGGMSGNDERATAISLVSTNTSSVIDLPRAIDETGPSLPQVFVVVGAVPGISGSPPCEPGGLSESAVTQRVAETLVRKLREAPIEVTLFGGSARNARPLTALRGVHADAVLILHTAGCDPSRSGFYICCWRGHEAHSASNQLANRLTEFYGSELFDRIVSSSALDIWERRDHALLHPDTGVRRSTPAVVVELGSLRQDSDALHSAPAVESMAIGLAKGVRQFLLDGGLLPYDWQHADVLAQERGEIPIEQNMSRTRVESLAGRSSMAIQPTSIPALSVSPGPAMLRELQKGGSFQLIHSVTGQPLAAPASEAPGCQALHLARTPLEESLWVLQAVGDHYRIIHRHSSRYLDAAPAGNSDGPTVMLCEFKVAENQHWQFLASDKQVQVVSRDGGGYLDIVGGRIIQNQSLGDSGQGWILRPVYPIR
jgi:hypothetical protein